MAEVVARSPLAHIAAASAVSSTAAPVSLRERPFRGLIDLRLDPASTAARQAAEAVIGLAVPAEPNRTSRSGDRCVLWLGPDEFLIVTEPGGEAALAAKLRQALQPHHAAVTDVTDGRTTLEISGPRARELIAKGCGLDLHPRVFGPGQCAQSGLAKARILIHQTDARPSFDILVERSHAEYLFFWLQDAMQEFVDAAAR